jgi:hypothetical protein
MSDKWDRMDDGIARACHVGRNGFLSILDMLNRGMIDKAKLRCRKAAEEFEQILKENKK